MPPATPHSSASASGAVASTTNQRSNSNQLNPNNKIDPKNSNNRGTDIPDPNSAMKIQGWEEDQILSRSKYLHKMEVLKRRHRRTKQLQRIYRDAYWALMEEVKLKHREYCWKFGISAFQQDNDSKAASDTLATAENTNGNGNSCEILGCKAKPMALTRFCYIHILNDSKQKLYKPCNFAIKCSPTGPILCEKPILRSTVPSYCSLHIQKAEKHVTRALKKAGLNVSNTSKLAPKYHVIVAEYVNQIQKRRRAAQKAALENAAEVKEESSS